MHNITPLAYVTEVILCILYLQMKILNLMKNKIIYLGFIWFVVIVFNPHNSHAQFFDFPSRVIDKAKLVITYTMKYKQDTNDLDFQREEPMLLIIGEKVSKFTSKNFYRFQQLGRQAEQEGNLRAFLDGVPGSDLRSRFSYTIYKNHPKGALSFVDKILPAFLIYEEDLNDFQWLLLNEHDLLSDYTVQKATMHYGGRNWTAWYTTEIPVNNGPYKFGGLPGLILKIHDSEEHYVFEMIAIERMEEGILIEFHDMGWVKTNRKDFLKAEENFRNDIISRAREAGAGSSAQQTAARNMARRNNPIELE